MNTKKGYVCDKCEAFVSFSRPEVHDWWIVSISDCADRHFCSKKCKDDFELFVFFHGPPYKTPQPVGKDYKVLANRHIS